MNRTWLATAAVALQLGCAAAAGARSRTAHDEQALVAASSAIVRADYRGDRAELARLAAALDPSPRGSLAAYRLYWRGFALWRRALNGENETPTPADVAADLAAGAGAFRAALTADPTLDEARIGLYGCLANEIFLAGPGTAERAALVSELQPVVAALRAVMPDNPRALWLFGGSQLFAPPPLGGDRAKAAATYRQGLDAARREALSAAPRPAWAPQWGAPELLMSLAHLHSSAPEPDLGAARAYALGALAMVPDWHYVRDLLLPSIEPEIAARP